SPRRAPSLSAPLRRPPPRTTLFPYTTLFRSAKAKLQQLEIWVQGDLQPDLTFLFDLDVASAAKRLRGMGQVADRFEQEKADFFRSEEHTSELQSRGHLVCRLLLEKKNIKLRR